MTASELADLFKPPAFLDGPLIDTTGDYDAVADVGFGEHFHYQDGYRAAADAVLALFEERGTTFDADTLVYSLVFLYRHSLELHLKELLYHSSTPAENHNLKQLWEAMTAVLRQEIGVSEREVDVVGERILELHRLDAGSTAIRYAYKRQKEGGGRSVTGSINVRLFAQRTQALCDTLDGWDTAIDEARSARAEMEAEYRDYNEP
jgi:hypothetical protein